MRQGYTSLMSALFFGRPPHPQINSQSLGTRNRLSGLKVAPNGAYFSLLVSGDTTSSSLFHAFLGLLSPSVILVSLLHSRSLPLPFPPPLSPSQYSRKTAGQYKRATYLYVE